MEKDKKSHKDLHSGSYKVLKTYNVILWAK